MRLDAEYRGAGFTEVSRLLLSGLDAGVPPGVAMRISTPSSLLYAAAGGSANVIDAVPADSGTLFDLASLTKVVATVPLVLLLHQRGAWSIDDPIARWLPDAPRSPATIRQCLTHTSGLVPHRPFFAEATGQGAIRAAVVAELPSASGGPVSYSDLGYMLLGWAAQECAGSPLEVLVSREILGPLGMASTGYRPAASRTRIAATEADGDQRLEPGLIWGQVHDGNAYALGGVSGHAGLFGTAADLSRFAEALLRPERHPVLSTSTISLMMSRQAGSGDDMRAIGWRLRPAVSGWGRWPTGTIWHTGFTGTSLLIAPVLDVAVVLLANAVHPARRLAEMTEFRRAVHRAVVTRVQRATG